MLHEGMFYLDELFFCLYFQYNNHRRSKYNIEYGHHHESLIRPFQLNGNPLKMKKYSSWEQ